MPRYPFNMDPVPEEDTQEPEQADGTPMSTYVILAYAEGKDLRVTVPSDWRASFRDGIFRLEEIPQVYHAGQSLADLERALMGQNTTNPKIAMHAKGFYLQDEVTIVKG